MPDQLHSSPEAGRSFENEEHLNRVAQWARQALDELMDKARRDGAEGGVHLFLAHTIGAGGAGRRIVIDLSPRSTPGITHEFDTASTYAE